jgi:hypothetical protein
MVKKIEWDLRTRGFKTISQVPQIASPSFLVSFFSFLFPGEGFARFNY